MAEIPNTSVTNVSLEKLREGLTESQRKYLELFWKKYWADEKWPFTFDIHRKYPKPEIANSLREIGGNPDVAGNIVREEFSSTGPVYQLTLIGILLTRNGKKYQKLLVRFIGFLRKEYFYGKKDGQNMEFDDGEITQALKLDDNQRRLLGILTRLETCYTSYGHTVGSNWRIRVPNEIQEIPKKGALDSYYEGIIFKYYKNQKRVFLNETKYEPLPPIPGPSFEDVFPPIHSAKNNIKPSPKTLSNSAKIFVSHSAYDKDLVQALTELLMAAFKLSSKDILCTTISGHKLPGGSDIEERLLASLSGAAVLIGVLTPASLESSYVLFELGARWGLKKPLISLAACGTKAGDIKEPLKSKVVLDASDEDEVHQLIEDVSIYLKEKTESPTVYNRKIRALALEAKEIKSRKVVGSVES